jgi:hypothetical protein
MTTGWRLTMTGVVVVGLASSLTACANATRNRESRLTQAGFRQVPADTKQKLAHSTEARKERNEMATTGAFRTLDDAGRLPDDYVNPYYLEDLTTASAAT